MSTTATSPIPRTTTLSYPLHYNSIQMNGPTLFYIDETGSPIQLQLNNEQVKMIVDDWNSGPDDSEPGDVSTVLKPPCAESVS